MSRYKGTFAISANYEPLIAAPFDARQLVECKADLTSTKTWARADGSVWTYAGMMVAVAQDTNPENNGIYVLIAEDYTLQSNWRKQANSTDIDKLREEIENISISGGGSLDIEVDTMEDLPEIGDRNITYYVRENSSIQRWNEAEQAYFPFGGSGEQPELNISLIYGGNSNGNTTD